MTVEPVVVGASVVVGALGGLSDMFDKHMEKLGTTIRLKVIQKTALLDGETSKKRFVYLRNQERIPLGPLGTSCYSLSREIPDQARGLLLESPENFSGPKSQLPNCFEMLMFFTCF